MNQFLHLPTIMVIYAVGTLMVGTISLSIWLKDRSNEPFRILILAAVVGIAGAVIHGLRNVAPFWLTTGVGFPLIFLGVGLFWCAYTAFEGRRPRYWFATAGAAVSIIITPLPLFQDSTVFRAVFAAVVIGIYNLLCAWETYRGAPKEPLPSRSLAIMINGCHGLLWFARIPLALFVEPPSSGESYAPWFVVVTLLSALHNIFAMFALSLLGKDRSERRYRIAAETDLLTGMNNRRFFVEHARHHLDQPENRAALLMFDIDKFKSINDTFGHAVGDKVLVAFSECLSRNSEPGWIMARLGGEEFACLIPHAGLETGRKVAERFRQSTERLCIPSENGPIGITVSAGVASNEQEPATLDSLLALADHNLYRAKVSGRNTVCAGSAADLLRGATRERSAAPARRKLNRSPLAS